MANFPFKDATFTSCADFDYPDLIYGRVYYTKINGVITAIKPIAVGIYRSTTSKDRTWEKRLKAMAADGKTYNLDMCGQFLFLSSHDAVEYEKMESHRTYCNPIGTKNTKDVIRRNGATVDWRTIKMYAWCSDGRAWESEGGYIFWADKDGEHIQFKETNKDGDRLYFDKATCVNDNVKVLDFTDDIPIPNGEYTVKREFTVKATSAEEAERIVDDSIAKNIKR